MSLLALPSDCVSICLCYYLRLNEAINLFMVSKRHRRMLVQTMKFTDTLHLSNPPRAKYMNGAFYGLLTGVRNLKNLCITEVKTVCMVENSQHYERYLSENAETMSLVLSLIHANRKTLRKITCSPRALFSDFIGTAASRCPELEYLEYLNVINAQAMRGDIMATVVRRCHHLKAVTMICKDMDIGLVCETLRNGAYSLYLSLSLSLSPVFCVFSLLFW